MFIKPLHLILNLKIMAFQFNYSKFYITLVILIVYRIQDIKMISYLGGFLISSLVQGQEYSMNNKPSSRGLHSKVSKVDYSTSQKVYKIRVSLTCDTPSVEL